MPSAAGDHRLVIVPSAAAKGLRIERAKQSRERCMTKPMAKLATTMIAREASCLFQRGPPGRAFQATHATTIG